MNTQELVSIKNLTVRTGSHVIIKDMSLDIREGELLGIAGESGSGKTMLVRALLGVLPEGVTMQAEKLSIFGEDCLKLSAKQRQRLVGANIGFVPQHTIEGLHPLLKISNQITEGYRSFRKVSLSEVLRLAEELLRKVGLEDTGRVLDSYPWNLSGGMRQRVNIAAALMNDPRLIIADEPTTALDSAVARQTMELLVSIAEETGKSIVMISHDLSMMRHYTRRIMITYAGRMMELGDTETIFKAPAHPYTRALTRVIPVIGEERPERLPEIPGSVPELGRDTEECIFAPRCELAGEICRNPVKLRELGGGHLCLCAKCGGDGDE